MSKLSRVIGIFSEVSRRAKVIWLFSKSLAPISKRTGIPLTSASANLNPGDFLESSIYVTIPFLFKASEYSLASSLTRGFLSAPIGIITTCLGAILGGNTKPLSSE